MTLSGVVVVGQLSGCASSPSIAVNAPVDPAGRLPADLAIEIAVSPGARIDNRVRVEERPARFVLLPDGSLHGATDLLPPDGVRPARVRRLAREQMADVWSALESAGFSNGSLADTQASVAGREPGANEVVISLEVQADGARFGFVRRFDPQGEGEQAIRRVVRTIAALAWASDEPLAESAELPTRYDLGPDPYARFAPRQRPAEEPAR